MAPLEIRDMAQDFLAVKGRDMLSKALAFDVVSTSASFELPRPR